MANTILHLLNTANTTLVSKRKNNCFTHRIS